MLFLPRWYNDGTHGYIFLNTFTCTTFIKIAYTVHIQRCTRAQQCSNVFYVPPHIFVFQRHLIYLLYQPLHIEIVKRF